MVESSLKIKSRFELATIIVIILVINLTVVSIGFNDFYSIILGQMINFSGFVLLFILARYHIVQDSGNKIHPFNTYLKKKVSLSTILLILLIVISSRIFTNSLKEIEFVKIFNMEFVAKTRYLNSKISDLQYLIIIFQTVIILIFGVISEEFYFRCYLFEVQFKTFKNLTWIVNGFSWSFYHIFSPTNFLAFLPTCLIYSYVYQKRRNIWITIIAHLINNFIAFYPVLKYYLHLL